MIAGAEFLYKPDSLYVAETAASKKRSSHAGLQRNALDECILRISATNLPYCLTSRTIYNIIVKLQCLYNLLQIKYSGYNVIPCSTITAAAGDRKDMQPVKMLRQQSPKVLLWRPLAPA